MLDDEATKQKLQKMLAKDLELMSKVTDLAYVIYTSGTTGKPKGVLVEQAALINTILWQIKNLNLLKTSSLLLTMSYAFDASISVIFTGILSGSKLCISRELGVNKEELELYAVTHLTTSSALTDVLLNNNLKCLKNLTIGGDKITAERVNKLVKNYEKVVYEYGVTEAAITNAFKVYDNDVTDVVIGRPVANTRTYILDSDLSPVPTGVIGELYIGGAGLSRGYLNQPKLTAERFIANPFATEADKAKGYTRLYKTGDLAKWLPDGNIEYIGRNDFQVKIRGFRIELGEIEAALSKINGIKQVTVQAKDKQTEAGTTKYLVAYYVKEFQAQITQEKIISHLSQSLPDYMIPRAFIELEKFPLTINGKLDRKALPDPEFINQDSYEAPTCELEKQLCKIWQEVLGIEQVGITDDFFRVGGDSILSILLSSKMRRAGFHCSVKDIFEHKTISSLRKLLEKQQAKTNIQTEQGILEGEFTLLPIQSWFFTKLNNKEFANPNHWNQSFLVKVPGLDIDKLQSIIPTLVEQHDILRANYKKDSSDKYIQNYNAYINIPELRILDISKITNPEKVHKILTDWQNNFEIEKGPLWQIGYIHGYKDKTARMYFALHHLIVDAVSWRILIEDIKSLYEQERLSSKTTSYRQWVKVVNNYAINNKEEQSYWENIQRDQQDYHQYTQTDTQVSELQLDQVTTKELISYANQAYHTEINDLLLTALGYALSNWNKSSINHITLEGHGREHIQKDIDLSRTVGWFTTAYPVRLEVQENLNQSIKRIKENLRAVPNKGLGYGAFKQNVNQSYLLKELPPISFNYLGQFDSQEGMWQVAGENSGESMVQSNQDSNIININGMVVEGKLWFSIVSKISKQATEELAAELKEQLELITQHCLDRLRSKEIEYTASDYNIQISQELLDKLQQQEKEANNTIQAIYPANSLQQGFIYHALSQEQDDAYRVQLLFDYHNPLNIENYKLAWELAIQSYPILRTSFNWEEDIIQIIHNKGQLNFTYHDLCEEKLFKNQLDEEIRRIQTEDRQQGFDLTKPTQLRLHLIKHTEKHYTVIKSEHHSISDGWSGPILLNKVHEFYKQLQQGIKPQVEEDQSYLKAQKYYQEHQEEIKTYWDKKIQTVEQVNDLNTMFSRAVDLDSIKSIEQAKEESIEITGELYQGLKQLAKDQGITINTAIQFAWHKLIQIYTRDAQTIVGTTVSGRSISVEGIEDSVGLYINTLPLIVNWKEQDQTTVAEQLNHIHQQITELNNHSYANLAELQRQGQRLFHSLFVFENYPLTEEKKGNIFSTKINLKLRGAITKLDYLIGIIVCENELGLNINFKYAGEYIVTDKVIRMLNQMKLILEQVLHPNNKVSDINILTEEEYQQLVYGYNQTGTEYPQDKTIYQLFEEQVKKTPNNIAVVFEDKKVTYKELNARSNVSVRLNTSRKS